MGSNNCHGPSAGLRGGSRRAAVAALHPKHGGNWSRAGLGSTKHPYSNPNRPLDKGSSCWYTGRTRKLHNSTQRGHDHTARRGTQTVKRRMPMGALYSTCIKPRYMQAYAWCSGGSAPAHQGRFMQKAQLAHPSDCTLPDTAGSCALTQTCCCEHLCAVPAQLLARDLRLRWQSAQIAIGNGACCIVAPLEVMRLGMVCSNAPPDCMI